MFEADEWLNFYRELLANTARLVLYVIGELGLKEVPMRQRQNMSGAAVQQEAIQQSAQQKADIVLFPQKGQLARAAFRAHWQKNPVTAWPVQHLLVAWRPAAETLCMTESGGVFARAGSQVSLAFNAQSKHSVFDAAAELVPLLRAGDHVTAEASLLDAVSDRWGATKPLADMLMMQRVQHAVRDKVEDDAAMRSSVQMDPRDAAQALQSARLRCAKSFDTLGNYMLMLTSSKAVFLTAPQGQAIGAALYTPLGRGISLVGQSFAENKIAASRLFTAMARGAHAACNVHDKSTLLASVDPVNEAQCWRLSERGFFKTGAVIKNCTLD